MDAVEHCDEKTHLVVVCWLSIEWLTVQGFRTFAVVWQKPIPVVVIWRRSATRSQNEYCRSGCFKRLLRKSSLVYWVRVSEHYCTKFQKRRTSWLFLCKGSYHGGTTPGVDPLKTTNGHKTKTQTLRGADLRICTPSLLSSRVLLEGASEEWTASSTGRAPDF